MLMVDGQGTPLSAFTTDAATSEVHAIETLVDERTTRRKPQRLMYDKAFMESCLGTVKTELELVECASARRTWVLEPPHRFSVSRGSVPVPIQMERDAALPDDDHKSLFLNWLDEHGSAVVKVARAYTLTAEDRQDLAQEILLQAWKSLPGFDDRASAATWFYRVALNTAMNWHRKDKPRRLKQQPLLEMQYAYEETSTVAQHAQHRETVERLYAAIHQLPQTDAALVLLYLDELSYREMADVMGISENHIGVKLNRAKKALTALMNGTPHAT